MEHARVELGRQENEDQKLAKGMEGTCVFTGNQSAECDKGAGAEFVGLCASGLVFSWVARCFRRYLAYVR